MEIGVVGLGYVRSPLVVEFAEAAPDGIAVDLDAWKVADLAGHSRVGQL